jgi:lysozyme family protein
MEACSSMKKGDTMATIELTSELRAQYQELFDSCEVRPEHAHVAQALVTRIAANQSRYIAVGAPLAIPWYVVGVIHCMEGGLNFGTHLHNGDPLEARTVHVPVGRPPVGQPPYKWEESAIDALTFDRLIEWHDWSIPGILYRLEEYNGFGYRTQHPEVLTPYLWSFSNHYQSGKYIADGRFSSSAVSDQCGAGILLRRMAEDGAIRFDTAGMPVASATDDAVERFEPMVHFSVSMRSPMVEDLQRMLNKFPGIFVNVDGIPGTRTSDAFKKVTGHFLIDDPRGQL